MSHVDRPVRRYVAGLEVLTMPPPGAPRHEVLLIHGARHGAWVWARTWMPRLAAAGHPVHAVSLRGHGDSYGRLSRVRLTDYVDDVVAVARELTTAPVLVGHSMGGLVAQRAVDRAGAPALVLAASVGPRHGVHLAAHLLRTNPRGLLGAVVGLPLRLRTRDLVTAAHAERADLLRRLGSESALVQWQLIAPRRVAAAGALPVLVLQAGGDRVVPAADQRALVAHYAADHRRYPVLGHDLMIDDGWEQPVDDLLTWLRSVGSGGPAIGGPLREQGTTRVMSRA